MNMGTNRYRERVLAMVEASQALQELLDAEGADGGQRLMREAQLLADDPTQPSYVQEGCRAMLRGQQASRLGLTPGETADREAEFHRRQDELGDDDSQK